MLGKLIKNEFKSTYKQMFVIYAMMIVATVFGCLVAGVEALQQGKIGQVLGSTFAMTYVIAVIALLFMTYVNMGRRFYTSMYSDQGYLTHTLPVKPLSNLNAKLFVSLVWMVWSGILLIVSLFSLSVAEGFPIREFFRELSKVKYSQLDEIAREMTGYSFAVTLLLILLFVLLSCLDALLLVFAAFSLGQLCNAHKVGAAVGWGIGLYLLQQITFVASIINFYEAKISPLYYHWSSLYDDYETFERSVVVQTQGIIWITLGLLALFAVIEYTVSAVIVNKRVNLQ